MKIAAYLLATLSVASAFAPSSSNARQSTQIDALFDRIANMDLWKDVKDSNDYGARNKKNLKVGNIGANSYVPAGLTAEQYRKIRATDEAKKKANYEKNVKKAGVFEDFTEFYLKRGTNEGGNWLKDPVRGHRMAKMKYDYSGKVMADQKKYDGAGSIFGKKK